MTQNTDTELRTLPTRVRARWNAEDWDDAKMTASKYIYEIMDDDGLSLGPIDLTESEANQYSWGICDDNLTGGSQVGILR